MHGGFVLSKKSYENAVDSHPKQLLNVVIQTVWLYRLYLWNHFQSFKSMKILGYT